MAERYKAMRERRGDDFKERRGGRNQWRREGQNVDFGGKGSKWWWCQGQQSCDAGGKSSRSLCHCFANSIPDLGLNFEADRAVSLEVRPSVVVFLWYLSLAVITVYYLYETVYAYVPRSSFLFCLPELCYRTKIEVSIPSKIITCHSETFEIDSNVILYFRMNLEITSLEIHPSFVIIAPFFWELWKSPWYCS